MTRALSDKARLCAANNANLYQSVFRAHGLADHRNDAMWWSEAPAPPYYSNLTTLDPDAVEPQYAAIDRLCADDKRSFSVKDGFCRLDLAPAGLRPLFDASWIWLERPANAHEVLPNGWMRISDAGSLELWEKAWAASSPTDERIFPPTILNDPDIAIFGRATGVAFDAGCIANRSASVLGLSNVFAISEMTDDLYRQAVMAACSFVPDLPLVGYERGDILQIARSAGFEPVWPLRVWLLEGAP